MIAVLCPEWVVTAESIVIILAQCVKKRILLPLMLLLYNSELMQYCKNGNIITAKVRVHSSIYAIMRRFPIIVPARSWQDPLAGSQVKKQRSSITRTSCKSHWQHSVWRAVMIKPRQTNPNKLHRNEVSMLWTRETQTNILLRLNKSGWN